MNSTIRDELENLLKSYDDAALLPEDDPISHLYNNSQRHLDQLESLIQRKQLEARIDEWNNINCFCRGSWTRQDGTKIDSLAFAKGSEWITKAERLAELTKNLKEEK